MERKDKKTVGLMVLGIITFIGVIVGATYAYFMAQGGNTSNAPVNVGTNTTDNLSFMVDKDISITANMDNFSNELGSVSGSAKAIATLIANNKTNIATGNYYLYLDITNNEFDYTTEEKTAELILNVIDKEGNEVIVNGLNKVTVTDRTGISITGYDITKVGGLITLIDNKEIKVEEGTINNTVTDEYDIKITFANLDSNQTSNGGKKFEATIKMQKEETVLPILAEYITNLYTTDGENGLYKHDGIGTYGEYEAGDNSIRYTKANPNNYVCFGSYAKKCPDDNLYRIIGVFDGKVKLIKNKSVGSMPWDSGGSNTWGTSSLKTYLNETFIKNIGDAWSNKIIETEWKVGGNIEKFREKE